VIGAASFGCLLAACGPQKPAEAKTKTGSVIFYHVDGTGIAHWQMARMVLAGPDGDINWDRLPHVAVYRGHAEDVLTPSSNAGATMHAYGVKAPHAAYGTDAQGQPPLAPSGRRRSIVQEAKERGLATGLVNSGHAAEPGTAAHVTSVAERDAGEEIASQLLAYGTDVLFSGGEKWFLPQEVEGRHGRGERKDGRNLVEEAKAAGYRVVFTREEMLALPDDAGKVLGLFARTDMFNAET
jgi:alkaline phosphatase